MSSSTSSSSGGGCPCSSSQCGWKFNAAIGDWVPIPNCNCPPGSICPKPWYPGADGEIKCMDCLPGTSSSSSGSGSMMALGQAESTWSDPGRTLRVVAVLPDLQDPSQHRRFAATVAPGGNDRILATSLGWMVYFRHRGPGVVVKSAAGGGVAAIELGDDDDDDVGIAAGIVLPEKGTRRRYWVPVTGRQPWATLSTAEWEVLFVRT